jgi:nitronate monooxygenase
MTPLPDFGLTIPVVAAPMSGRLSTPAMVLAASRAGALGFLAAGYKTPEGIRSEISAVRSASIPFGVNVFAPNRVPVSPDAYRRYANMIQREADRLGLVLPRGPIEDDDYFEAKIDLLVSDPVPIVSFIFAMSWATRPMNRSHKRAKG